MDLNEDKKDLQENLQNKVEKAQTENTPESSNFTWQEEPPKQAEESLVSEGKSEENGKSSVVPPHARAKGGQRLKHAKDKKKDKKRGWVTAAIIAIIILILLLLRSCGGNTDGPLGPIGNFVVGAQQQEEQEEKKEEEKSRIAFAGYGRRTVTEEKPNIELRNPDSNFVDMVFTITDRESGEIIARTDKVEAGQYVYVNVWDFYGKPGTYWVDIDVSTCDHESGSSMNGVNQEVELILK